MAILSAITSSRTLQKYNPFGRVYATTTTLQKSKHASSVALGFYVLAFAIGGIILSVKQLPLLDLVTASAVHVRLGFIWSWTSQTGSYSASLFHPSANDAPDPDPAIIPIQNALFTLSPVISLTLLLLFSIGNIIQTRVGDRRSAAARSPGHRASAAARAATVAEETWRLLGWIAVGAQGALAWAALQIFLVLRAVREEEGGQEGDGDGNGDGEGSGAGAACLALMFVQMLCMAGLMLAGQAPWARWCAVRRT